jgi:hypothetical protein
MHAQQAQTMSSLMLLQQPAYLSCCCSSAAALQIGFMTNFAASTLSSIKVLLPNAAAEVQQHFDSNLARWQTIANNSSSNTAAS